MLNRRRFLRVSGLAASAGAAGCVTSPRPSRAGKPAAERLGPGFPRRIIHVVSDGMSMGTLSCADQLSLLERQRHLTWLELHNRPDATTALMDMRSLDSLVTDSAAASSSWGSGARVPNGVLNVSSTGRSLVPLMSLFEQAGWKRGLVTTTEITHATPAGFTVSVAARGEGEEIASRYLDARLDVLLGGGGNHFDATKRKDKRNLWAEFTWAGYHVAKTAGELEKAPTGRPWLGTFAAGHLPFTLDHRASPTLVGTVPTLATLVDRALDKLGREDRFLLQVEGGRVDHACHNNDAAAALRDQIALDEALDVIMAYRQRHPETLVVITTDHGNANLGLNGIGTAYRESSERFRNVAAVQASFPEILKALKAAKSENESTSILADTTGYRVGRKKLVEFLPFVAGKGSTLFGQMNADVAALGQLLANHIGIGFTGTSHTSDYVPVIALGPGSERFRGILRNTDIFGHYTDLAGIDYRNPEEPLLASAPRLPAPEDVDAYALA